MLGGLDLSVVLSRLRSLAGAAGASLIGFLQFGSGAVAESLQSRGRWKVNITDYLSESDRALVRAGTSVDIATAFSNAVAALPSTGGIVDASMLQGDVTAASTLTLGSSSKPVMLLLHLGRLISQANPVISGPSGGASAIIGAAQGGTSIVYNGVANDGIVWECSHGRVENLLISAGASARHGLVLKASGTNNVRGNNIANLRLAGPTSAAGSIGVRLIGDSATAIATLNNFSNLRVWDYDVNVNLETSGTQGPTDNNFWGVEIGGSNTGTAGVRIQSGNINNFWGLFVAGKATGISISGGAQYNSFHGARLETNTTNVTDAGTGTMYRGLSMDADTATFPATATVDGYGNVARASNKGRILNAQSFLTAVTGTGAFATLFTYTLPANTLGKNGALRVTVGYLHGTGAATPAYKLTLGGSTLTAFNDASTGSVSFETLLFNAGAANAQAATTHAVPNGTGFADGGHASTAVDTTSDQTLAFQFNVAATDAVTPRVWTVELIQ